MKHKDVSWVVLFDIYYLTRCYDFFYRSCIIIYINRNKTFTFRFISGFYIAYKKNEVLKCIRKKSMKK